MAPLEFNLSFLTGDDAAFRNWIQTWHTKLAALGLVRLTEGSPINPSTVTKPAGSQNLSDPFINLGSDVVAGTDIWRFNDALQNTKPVFIKFYYAVHGFSVYSYAYDPNDAQYGKNSKIRLYFEVGQATDGNGNLYGYRSPMREIGSAFLIQEQYIQQRAYYTRTPSDFNTYKQVLMSGGAGALAVMFGANSPADYIIDYAAVYNNQYAYGDSEKALSPLLVIERSCNADGSDNGDAINILHCGFNGSDNQSDYTFLNKGATKMQCYFPFGEPCQTVYGHRFSSLANFQRNTTFDAFDARLCGVPILTYDNGLMKNPIKRVISSMMSDFGVGINVINAFGSNHNYRKPDNQIRGSLGNQGVYSALMLFWE